MRTRCCGRFQGAVQRVGSNQTISVDVRLIAATHRDGGRGECWSFSPDLYCRLNVVAIEMPSLRQRREDIRYWQTTIFLRRFAGAVTEKR